MSLKESVLLEECLEEHGYLILSGILLEQKENIKREFILKGFKFVDEKTRGPWPAILMSMTAQEGTLFKRIKDNRASNTPQFL